MVASLPKRSMALAALLSLSHSATAQSPQYTTVVVPEVTVYCPYVPQTDSMGHTIPFCAGDETTVTTGSYTVTDVLVTGIETLGYVGFPGGSKSAVTSFATYYSLVGTLPGAGGDSSSASDASSSSAASSTEAVSSGVTSSAAPSEPTSTAAPSETTPTSVAVVSSTAPESPLTSAPVSTATVVVGSNPSGTAEPGSVSVSVASSPAAPISTGAAADVKVSHAAFAAVAGVAGVVAAVM